MAIIRSSGVDTIHMYVDSLPEGTYNFEVTTFDAHGNKSVPSDITSNVYGDKYSATLLNIPVLYTQAASGDTAVVVFGQYDPTTGLIGRRQATTMTAVRPWIRSYPSIHRIRRRSF